MISNPNLISNSLFMKNVSLQFPTILQLVDFTLAINSNFCHMNKQTFVLTCDLSDIEIELAQRTYKAVIL